MGRASTRDDELLSLAEAQFDVLVTADRNLSYQQDVSSFDIAVLVLVARSNRLDDLGPLSPKVREVLATARRGTLTLVVPQTVSPAIALERT